jgi:hypothetical protein
MNDSFQVNSFLEVLLSNGNQLQGMRRRILTGVAGLPLSGPGLVTWESRTIAQW